MLVAFALGWAMLGVLSSRFTNRPQRWSAVPAVAMGVSGLALVVLTPENATLTAMSWIWPVPILALVAYIWVRARGDLPGTHRPVHARVR